MALPIRLVRLLARAVGMKKIVTHALVGPKRRRVGACRASRFGRRLETEEWQVEGHWVTTIRPEGTWRRGMRPLGHSGAPEPESPPTDGSERPLRHVVYLHGGGYASEATVPHRVFLRRLVEKYGFVVTFVDYPLTPEFYVEDTHRVLLQAYRDVARRNPGDEFSLMGDSAGGGLALAFAQVLRDLRATEGAAAPPRPVASVLLSPWVDVTMTNPAIIEDAERDPMLAIAGCIEAGRRYARDVDPEDPRVSPLRGRLEDLGPFLVFAGTEEILRADCVALAERLAAASGSSAEIQVENGMVHDWVLAPGRESRAAIARIVAFLRAEGAAAPSAEPEP